MLCGQGGDHSVLTVHRAEPIDLGEERGQPALAVRPEKLLKFVRNCDGRGHREGSLFSKRARCGRCNQIVDFGLVHADEYRATEPLPSQREMVDRLNLSTYKDEITAYGTAICPLCGMPSLLLFTAQRRHARTIMDAIRSTNSLDGTTISISIEELLPVPIEPVVDPLWPAEIHDLFRDAQAMLNEGRSPSMIIGACRSVVDVSAKALNAVGKNLEKKIDDLRDKGLITEGLASWAHQTRLAGNEALHEIKGTPAEAKELVDFTRMLLDVAFTLPKTITAKQAAKQAAKAAAAPVPAAAGAGATGP